MLKKFVVRNQEGASAVEYGLIVGLIAVAIIATVTAIGGNLDLLFVAVDDALTAAVPL